MDRETYLFHQTPNDLANELIKEIDFKEGDIVLEPFRGEGAFYNNFPDYVDKEWCELEEGRDYKDHQGEFDWVISNPPFRLDTGGKRVNSFYYLLDYYSKRARKGIAFLGNDYCFGTLTPNRIKDLQDRGWYLNKVRVCSIKKWRGRYFFLVFTKEPTDFYGCVEGNWA